MLSQSITASEAVLKSVSNKISSLVKGYPSLIRLKVQWGEQDAFGHLNNVTYCRYFESGRMDYFLMLAEKASEKERRDFVEAKGVGPILRDMQLRYKFPVTYPDSIIVATKGSIIGKDRFLVNTVMASERHENVVLEASGTIVIVDYANGGQKCNIPMWAKTAIDELES